jgi:hypothetical protein
MDEPREDDEVQTWTPRRGVGFRVIAWAILLMIAAGVIAMLLRSAMS